MICLRRRNGRPEWILTAIVTAIWLAALWIPEINPWLEWALFLGGLAVVGFLAGDARVLLGLIAIPVLALLHPEPTVNSLAVFAIFVSIDSALAAAALLAGLGIRRRLRDTLQS